MKKVAVNEAESSIDRLHKSALPRISYNRAMASYFIVPRSGVIQSVETASVEEFTALVHSCKLPDHSGRNRQLLKSCLAGLDYRQHLDKWYALNELIMAGAAVPIFATCEQARAASVEKETMEV